MASSVSWVATQISNHDNVQKLSIEDGVIVIRRKQGEDLKIAVVSCNPLLSSDIKHIKVLQDIGFILNIPKDAYVHGAVINYFEHREIAVGGLGDAYRVLSQEINWPYQNPEVKFVRRGLEQHTRVTRVRRLDSRRFEIERRGLSTVVILMLNDYDLSVESVRNGKQVYGDFHAILASNPNARISGDASDVAEGLAINIYKWRELLGKLNHQWI